MAINFPNSPSNGDTHSDGITNWSYSSANHAWTVTNSSPVSLDNTTDHDNVMVVLDRISSQNLLTPAVNFTYNPTTKTLTVKANVSQTENMVELKNSAGSVLNAFNQRGVLTGSGRIYFTGTTPTPHASDSGLLWYNTTDGNLYVWNGTLWVITSGGVNLIDNQTIAGAKTFSTNIMLSSTAAINGQGVSKSIDLKPTNASSVASTALSLSTDEATFSVPVEFSELGNDAKTVVVTLDDDQTIAGLKTFSDNIILSGVQSSVASDPGTDGGSSGPDLRLRANMSEDGRYIKLFNNANVLNGITIRPKNKDNIGSLSIDGNTSITGNLTVSGSFVATTVTAVSSVFGQLASTGGSATYNVNITPDNLGNITFTNTTTGAATSRGITAQNTSSTQSAKFFVRRERSGAELGVSIHKIVLAPSTSVFINATTGPVADTGVTITYYGGAENTALNLTVSNSPVRYEFYLAS